MNKDNSIVHDIVSFLDQKKAWNIIILDLKDVSGPSDFFIIANSSNIPHLKSLYDGLLFMLKKKIELNVKKSGIPESGWMILDVYGIMIHLFEENVRDFYNLEGLWKDAERIQVKV